MSFSPFPIHGYGNGLASLGDSNRIGRAYHWRPPATVRVYPQGHILSVPHYGESSTRHIQKRPASPIPIINSKQGNTMSGGGYGHQSDVLACSDFSSSEEDIAASPRTQSSRYNKASQVPQSRLSRWKAKLLDSKATEQLAIPDTAIVTNPESIPYLNIAEGQTSDTEAMLQHLDDARARIELCCKRLDAKTEPIPEVFDRSNATTSRLRHLEDTVERLESELSYALHEFSSTHEKLLVEISRACSTTELPDLQGLQGLPDLLQRQRLAKKSMLDALPLESYSGMVVSTNLPMRWLRFSIQPLSWRPPLLCEPRSAICLRELARLVLANAFDANRICLNTEGIPLVLQDNHIRHPNGSSIDRSSTPHPPSNDFAYAIDHADPIDDPITDYGKTPTIKETKLTDSGHRDRYRPYKSKGRSPSKPDKLYAQYNKRWERLSPEDPDIPFPCKSLTIDGLLKPNTFLATYDWQKVGRRNAEAHVHINVQIFFLEAVGLKPRYSNEQGQIQIGFDDRRATLFQIRELARILKLEVARWHPDRLGRRHGGSGAINERLQQDEIPKFVFNAVCALAETGHRALES